MNLGKIKWLVPVLAILVILESVIVIDRLSGEQTEVGKKLPLSKITQTQQPALMTLEGNETMRKGEVGQFKVVLTALEDLNLDGVDIYLKYEPEMIEVLGIDPTERFTYVGRNWIEPEKERVLVSLMEPEKPAGVEVSSGNQMNLALVKFKALSSGKTKLMFYKPEGEKGTVLAGEGKNIDFSKKDLVLEVK